MRKEHTYVFATRVIARHNTRLLGDLPFSVEYQLTQYYSVILYMTGFLHLKNV